MDGAASLVECSDSDAPFFAVRFDEVVVVVGVVAQDSVDFLVLAWAQGFVFVEAPDAYQ